MELLPITLTSILYITLATAQDADQNKDLKVKPDVNIEDQREEDELVRVLKFKEGLFYVSPKGEVTPLESTDELIEIFDKRLKSSDKKLSLSLTSDKNIEWPEVLDIHKLSTKRGILSFSLHLADQEAKEKYLKKNSEPLTR